MYLAVTFYISALEYESSMKLLSLKIAFDTMLNIYNYLLKYLTSTDNFQYLKQMIVMSGILMFYEQHLETAAILLGCSLKIPPKNVHYKQTKYLNISE